MSSLIMISITEACACVVSWGLYFDGHCLKNLIFCSASCLREHARAYCHNVPDHASPELRICTAVTDVLRFDLRQILFCELYVYNVNLQMKLATFCYFSMLFSPWKQANLHLSGKWPGTRRSLWKGLLLHPVNWKYFVIHKPLPKHGKRSLLFGLYILQTLPWA